MILVLNSTPLIYFARIGMLGVLERLPDRKIIPKAVYEETVVKGKGINRRDAFIIDKLVKDGAFRVEEAKEKFLGHLLAIPRLDRAEAEVLALAKELGAAAVIDDMAARSAADIEGIRYGGSAWLLFRLVRQKIIRKGEAKKFIDEMIKAGWRCSTELYAAILKELEEL